MPKSFFYTSDKAKAEIIELEAAAVVSAAEIATLTADLATANADLVTANATIAGHAAELETAATAVTEAETALTKANADLAAANVKLGTFDADVENAAAARFAGLGGDPLPSASADATQSKAEITGLSGIERSIAIHKQQAESRKKNG